MDESTPARRPSPRPTPAASGTAPSGQATKPPAAPDPPKAQRARTPKVPRTEPRFDATSWSGAIIVMLAFAAALWVVQIVNAHRHYDFNRYGLRPRSLHGLWGVLTQPFLHSGYDHMLANTVPLVLIGWVVLLAGVRLWLFVTISVIVVGGLLTWLVGPSNTVIVGASGLFFGWLGYLIARAVFSRKIKWIISAAMVLAFFGALLNGLIPAAHSDVSWQSHVCSFVVGFGVGWLLHPRRARRRSSRRSAVL